MEWLCEKGLVGGEVVEEFGVGVDGWEEVGGEWGGIRGWGLGGFYGVEGGWEEFGDVSV